MIDNDNIDMGGGFNPATGAGDAATAYGAQGMPAFQQPPVTPKGMPAPSINQGPDFDAIKKTVKSMADRVAGGDMTALQELMSDDNVTSQIPPDVWLKKSKMMNEKLAGGKVPTDPSEIASMMLTDMASSAVMANKDAHLSPGEILKKLTSGAYAPAPNSPGYFANQAYGAALFAGAGQGGATQAYVDTYKNQMSKIQNKMVDMAFKPLEQQQQIATNDKMYSDIRQQTMKRMGGNLAKYADKYGITQDQVGTAQQLLQMAVETEDYNGVRERAASIPGMDKPWFRQLLLKTQMEVAQREQELTKLTGRQSNNHITAGNQIAWYDSTGKMVESGQRATLNGQPIITLDNRPNEPLTPEEIQAKNTKYGMYQDAAKGTIAAGQKEAAVASAKADVKSLETYETDVMTAAKSSGQIIGENGRAIEMLKSNPKLMGQLQSMDPGLLKSLAVGAQEGVTAFNSQISLPLEQMARAANLSESEVGQARYIEQVLGRGLFTAVKDADLKGSLSDGDMKAIMKSIASSTDPAKTVQAYLVMQKALAEVAETRNRAMIEEKRKLAGTTGKLDPQTFQQRFADGEINGFSPRVTLKAANAEIDKLLNVKSGGGQSTGAPVGGYVESSKNPKVKYRIEP